jgi:dipeptidyl aminopeptidase/acylaminoacyl peptidase
LLQGAFDWSPDGREIVFTHTRSPALDHWTTADVSIVETGSGRVRQFQQSNAAEFAPSYSPDGEHIAFSITMYPPSWIRQSRVAVARRNGTGLKLLAATFDEQPRIVGWITRDTVLVEEPHGTHTALWKLPRDGGEPLRFDDGDAVLSAATLNEPATRLALVTMNRQRPQEAAVTPLRRYRPQTVSAANAGAPDYPLEGTGQVTWSAADGLAIEGLLTLPAGYRRGQRYPLVLMIHGGPAGVFTQDYPGYPQEGLPVAPLADRGYAILQANPRGSSGYGYAFRAANRSDWGGADYEDLMAGIDHLIDKGVADPERLGVMGWSYGGFMSAWMVTRSHRFSAAVAGAPVTDLTHLAATTDIGGFLPDYLEGEFWESQLYRSRSPLLQAHRITTPTLVLHGEADVRVPPDQGRALHNALQRRGQTSRMVLYPRAAHLLTEPGHLVHTAREVLNWFDRHLPAGQ